MHIVMVPGENDQGWLCRLTGNDTTTHIDAVDHLAATVKDLESREHPRWVLADTATDYPPLIQRGTRLGRCHDLTLTEAILLSTEGQAGQAHSIAAAHARLHDLPVPETETNTTNGQDTLFDVGPDKTDGPTRMNTLIEIFRNQQQRHTTPALRLLTAAESAGSLIAAEMTHHGLPWRTDIHDTTLTELLGPRPIRGMRPKKLQLLADDIGTAFGRPLNPDSPQQILAAFTNAGHPITTTRAWEIQEIDHPAVKPLLRYKELSRIYSSHGWNWSRDWITDGPAGPDSPAKRFRPKYVVGGVVTGRWATDGGAALQLPKTLRSAVTADPGWKLIVADASQLEPRILAAMSNDGPMTTASQADDLYTALAPTFNGNRDDAKIALLSAMYGGTAGNATALLTLMRQRFPRAYNYVTAAAKTGETGGLVHTWLGRTCPPATTHWWNDLAGPGGTRTARDRGRFTRNFIVQGTAAEWALAMMAILRNRLHETGHGHLVFFQHDEIIIHSPSDHAGTISTIIQKSADTATRLLFGDAKVHIPLHAKIVTSYAEAK